MDSECQIHSQVAHPNVVKLMEVIETQKFCVLVLELLHSTLSYVILLEDGLPDELTRQFMWQISGAVEYLHRHFIAHLDVKNENILVDSARQTAKLSDFGVAVQLTADTWNQPTLTEGVGTVLYASPEVFQCYEMDGTGGYKGGPADVWSFAVCIVVCKIGNEFFDIIREIQKKDLDYFLDSNFADSELLKMIVLHCFKLTPEARPSISEIKEELKP
jgi:serine/threonine protein kinase